MGVLDLFSFRKRLASGNTPDVFVYDELPEKLRVQIIHIWREAIGPFDALGSYFGESVSNNNAWIWIHNAVAREHGVMALSDEASVSERCCRYLLTRKSVDEALDVIEASFLYIDRAARKIHSHERERLGMRVAPDDAIEELNERFRRAGVGYRFEEGRIFRVDSELIHSEVVRPAVRYLHERGFEGPRDEFLQAHAHYRAGETEGRDYRRKQRIRKHVESDLRPTGLAVCAGRSSVGPSQGGARERNVAQLPGQLIRPTGRHAQVGSAKGEKRGRCPRPRSQTTGNPRLRCCLRAPFGRGKDSVSRRSAQGNEMSQM